jgi:hypothetical protein
MAIAAGLSLSAFESGTLAEYSFFFATWRVQMHTAGTSRGVVGRLTAIGTATLLAIGMLALSAAAALAGPESGVDVVVHDADTETVAPGDPPTACTFHLHFQAGTAIEGGWQIRPGNEDAAPVVEGTFDTTSGDSRAPETGVFELDPGTYVVTWDDEIEQDRSFDEQTVVVACAAPTGSEPGASGGSASPSGSEPGASGGSASPSGSELPVAGSPSGNVAGVTVTPPATDSGTTRAGGGSGAWLAISIIVGLAALLLSRTLRLSSTILVRDRDRRR